MAGIATQSGAKARRCDIHQILPEGFALKIHTAGCLTARVSTADKATALKTFAQLASIAAYVHSDSEWTTKTGVDESFLQRDLRKFLAAAGIVDVTEGARLAGGEYDLVVEGRSLIENKDTGEVADPFEAKPAAPD